MGQQKRAQEGSDAIQFLVPRTTLMNSLWWVSLKTASWSQAECFCIASHFTCRYASLVRTSSMELLEGSRTAAAFTAGERFKYFYPLAGCTSIRIHRKTPWSLFVSLCGVKHLCEFPLSSLAAVVYIFWIVLCCTQRLINLILVKSSSEIGQVMMSIFLGFLRILELKNQIRVYLHCGNLPHSRKEWKLVDSIFFGVKNESSTKEMCSHWRKIEILLNSNQILSIFYFDIALISWPISGSIPMDSISPISMWN